MKRPLRVLAAAVLIAAAVFGISRFFSAGHSPSFTTTDRIEVKQKAPGQRMTDAIGAAEYEFNLLKDPATGTIPEGIRAAELAQARRIYETTAGMRTTVTNAYTFQGPSNLGGRTRALVYDVRYNGTSNQVILAGGVSGGLFKSTDNAATWVRKTPTSELYSVTSIAQDPRPGFQDTWYYSTGEAIGNSASGSGASYMGNGVYKSTNNGETWTRLPNSNPTAIESFTDGRDFTHRIVVNPVNGHLYWAVTAAIYKSTDGGTTWTSVLSGTLTNSGQSTDVVVTSAGRIYAAFGGTNSTTVDGVWTSTIGDAGTWTQIAGAGAGGSPTGWNNTYRRIVLHKHELPTDTLLFALYDNNVVSSCAPAALEADLFRWNQVGGTWTDLSTNLPDEAGCLAGNDPFATQGGYDLVVKTKPDDPNVVFVGGTNIYRSTDGFTTATNTTRIGGYVNSGSYGLYTNSHPDIHEITFQPGSPSIMICSNDGGIQRTTNVLAATVSWTHVATDYRTYQYYYVAIDPRIGNAKVLGGAQDNGTTRNIGGTGTSHEMVRSGDGVSVGLSNVIAGNTYEYCGSQSGNISRRNSTSVPLAITNIRPAAATGNGLFVTLFKLDEDNTENLYYVNTATVYRNTSASTATTANWTTMSGTATAVTGAGATNITALAVTRGTYAPATSSLFFGTNSGDMFRLDDPVNAAAAAAPVNITGAGFPAAGNVSSIAVNPRNDDTVLVTFSNYGVTSIFWTGNANSATPTWQNVEGNLTLPSVRSSAIAITSAGVEYFVGTSVGLFNTTINGASPGATTWVQDGATDIGNAVVSSLAHRPVDNRLLVGTHGSGMWITTLTAPLPVSLTEFTGRLQRNNVVLDWKTASEQNTRVFEVEKSYDGLLFKKIGTVAAAGNSSSLRTYSFTDPEPAVEINYYRLKTVDMDNASRLSNIVQVKNPGAQLQVGLGANPFANQLTIRFGKIPQGKVSIQLLDLSGKQVYKTEYSQLSSPVITINPATNNRLAAGAYLVDVWADKKHFMLKAVKQ